MKVLHINSYYSGSGFYKNLYDKQVEKGVDIDVFVPVSSSTSLSNLNLGEYTNISVNHRKNDRILFYLKQNKIYKSIKQQYRIENYSIIHAHSLFSNGYIGLKLKRKFGIPYVVTVRNTDVNYFFKYMVHLRKVGIEILKEAYKVIFISNTYKNLVIEKYVFKRLRQNIISKSIVIPNGIDDFWFYNKNLKKTYTKSKKIKLIYVGTINKNKNIGTTIKAIHLLQKNGFSVEFDVVVYGKIKVHSNAA